MKWYTQNCAISFGKTLRALQVHCYSALLSAYVISINYMSSKDLSTNTPIALVLRNGASTLE